MPILADNHHSHNYRVTRQRKIVLEELRKINSHPTAKELHKVVLKRKPDIGLATVYRTLKFLETNNLIIKLKTLSGEARYDGDIQNHLHLICNRCGKVEDIFDIKDINIYSRQLKESGFQMDLSYLEISGLCKRCHLYYL